MNGKPVDLRRVKPTIVTLTDLKLTYEAFEDVSGGMLPYYCYVGAILRASCQYSDPLGMMRDELAKLNPKGAPPVWTDFQIELGEGQTAQWKKLRFVGPQEFLQIDKSGQRQLNVMPGMLEIYCHDEAGYLFIIAWRMPLSIEEKVGLAKWAKLVASCVSVKQ